VRIQQLHLTNFRSYRRLSLTLPPATAILYGLNGQGKSNVLEAVYFLATARSFRARQDRELLNWDALATEPEAAFARVAALAERRTGSVRVDVVIAPQLDTLNSPTGVLTRKQITVNGIKRQPGELVGQLLATLFTPADVDLVTGAPDLRRRYLDITLSQTDRQYLRTLLLYQRILTQRNSLLRNLRDGKGRSDQLAFWDDELAKAGCYVLDKRRRAVAKLATLIAPLYADLSGETASLELRYVPSLDTLPLDETQEINANDYRVALHRSRSREIAAGMSLVGPHRDDVLFLLGGRPLTAFASRGQIRSCTVALKLSEVAYMQAETSETPVLLLDDVLSELDYRRRSFLLEALPSTQQILVTTTERDALSESFLRACHAYHVTGGDVIPD
jgi:DNA replication and repair protein RecF